MKYLVKIAGHYVESWDGMPTHRTTTDRSKAVRFVSEREAREWAGRVFFRFALEDVAIIPDEPGTD